VDVTAGRFWVGRSRNSPTLFEFWVLARPRFPLLVRHSGDEAMPNGEIATSSVGPTIELKQEIEALAESAMAPVQSAALDLQENAQGAVSQVKDAVTSALDALAQSGSADQMRGYANAAMGKTKLAVALATQSPELVLAGLAQQAIGEMQKFVGKAKSAGDPEERGSRRRASSKQT
jgi:uncharacterized protein YjbJ (UPF0337 family)